MSKNKTSHSRPSYRDLQAQIESYRKKRDKLNQKTKEYINGLQKIEEEIHNHLKTARDVYKKKRDMWNKRVKKLKSKKIEYKNLLDNLFEEKRKVQRSRGKEQPKYVSIKQLDYKIE
ncbi:MAG: hypothetical protein GF353_25180, partial [Candidatus Lokiarchaeota archaeon]|nr:hypothetical protein [Candidatus Lokiarchaeota archaeon]